MKKYFQSKRDSEETIKKIENTIGSNLGLKSSSQVLVIQPDNNVSFYEVSDYVFILIDDKIVPFVGSQKTLSLLPSVYVDMGAVKHILNGADVMRPGVVRFDDWGGKDRIVVIREIEKLRGIAVGLTLVESEEMHLIKKGACVKNLTHVGDKYWNLYKLV